MQLKKEFLNSLPELEKQLNDHLISSDENSLPAAILKKD